MYQILLQGKVWVKSLKPLQKGKQIIINVYKQKIIIELQFKTE